MEKLEEYILVFCLLFSIIFIIDYFFVKRRHYRKSFSKKKNKNKKDLTEIAYLVGKFKLDKNKLPMKGLLIVISLINAFIISFVAIVIISVKSNILIQMLLGFILLLALIYALYEILGRYLERRGQNKDEF